MQSTPHDNIEKIKKILDQAKADYEIVKDNKTLSSAKEGAANYQISLTVAAPTFILKHKTGYIVAIISGATKISFKKLKQVAGLKDLAMAKPDEIFALTSANVGYVSLINPQLKTIIDNKLLQNQNCFGGCGVPNYTLRIKTSDLVKITNAEILDFTESK